MTLIAKDEYCYNCGQMHPRWIDGCTNAKVVFGDKESHYPRVDITDVKPKASELDQHIQQMAETEYKFLKERIVYKRGIKDADAIGFADWIDENYHKDNNTLWFNRYDNEPKGFSTEELYHKYLNREE